MLNKYPAWKNILILIVVILGFLYSLPNLYPDDPALQVSHELTELSAGDLPTIMSALEAAEVNFFGEEVDSESILIRLNNLDDQLRAKTAIEEALGDSYIVALNLAPTTPGYRRRKNEPWFRLARWRALSDGSRYGCGTDASYGR
jgi:preprotein translocase subunit SecD